MKNIRNMIQFRPVLLIVLFVTLLSCEDLVEDGYRADYVESDAELTVEALGYESGAIGDVISYELRVSSEHEIKSCVIQATNEGANGSGYDVGTEGYDDPFADHNYGTMKKDVYSFVVKYDYVIPEDVNKSKITFSVIDEMGKVSEVVSVKVVPDIKLHEDVNLYALNNIFFDAFATINGLVYPDVKNNYSQVTSESLDVQEKIDIVYFYDKGSNQSIISSVSSGWLSIELEVENHTRFMRLPSITDEDFESLTAASLIALTEKDSIAYYGYDQVGNVQVGDIVGFTTDLIAIHSLKTGLIKVNGLHPVNVGHYEGTAYVMECDIVSQID